MFVANNAYAISPCTGQCGIDETDTCKGCTRSSQEITDWMHMSEDEKISIVIRCKKEIARREQND